MGLNVETAIRIWITDEGYRKINSYLSGSTSRTDYIYHQPDNLIINYEGITYKTIDVINIIKENMKESNKEEIYYRGGSAHSKKSFVKKTFISVTTDIEQAETFIDGDCCLFKIIVDPHVKRYKTGVENEVLLENNLYWNYIGKENNYYIVRISKGDLMQENISNNSNMQNKIKSTLTEEELNSLIDDYKEECNLLDEEPTPQGLIDYISITTANKQNISLEKATGLINNVIGGSKKVKKTKQKSKKTKQKSKKNKTKKSKKNKTKK
jgi:hypothetical protein